MVDFSKDVQGRWLKKAVEALDTFLRNEQTATPTMIDADREVVRAYRRHLSEMAVGLMTEGAQESEVAEALEWWGTQDEEEYDPHIVTLMERAAGS